MNENSEFKIFFNKQNIIELLTNKASILISAENDRRSVEIGEMLQMIANDPESFDRNCQFNIARHGERFLNVLSTIGVNPVKNQIDSIIAITYRFMVEYDLSTEGEMAHEINIFLKSVLDQIEVLNQHEQAIVKWTRQEMAATIVKTIVNSKEFGSLRNLSKNSDKIKNSIQDWQDKLSASEAKATHLGEILEKHTKSFNFVGLHKGFSDLDKGIKLELIFAQVGMFIFGLLSLVPSTFDFYTLYSRNFDISTLKVETLIVIAACGLAITFLLLYFFRIALRKANSCRAQLIQVHLRMSLCKFIESYVEFSSNLKTKNIDALSKFETLIFSGIVSSDEKLPSTFDGIEQIAALAKTISGKP